MSSFQDIRDAFRQLVLRELRPIEDRDGLRVGEDVRVTKEKDKYLVRFLKGTDEKRKKVIREKLDMANVAYTEGKDFKD
jgi:hypothetical protein